MWPKIKRMGGVILAGGLVLAGSALAEAAPHHPRHRARPAVHAPYGPPHYGRPEAPPPPAPNWDSNASGTVNGLSYDPRWCYAPGSCVFGFH